MNVTGELLRTGLLTAGDIAQVIGTTPRSVQRWASGSANPRRDALARLLELAAVTDLAAQVIPAGAGVWLHSPVPALGYDKPLDVIRAGGYRRVVSTLTVLGEGISS